MATNRTEMTVPVSRVFDVLMDPKSYADWVVGSDTIRDVDASWPSVGSRFHHRVGTGPLKVNDHTEIVEIKPPGKLVLHARARPVGTAIVTLLVEPSADGAMVTIKETAGDALSRLAINPVTDWLVHLRNRETLRRLKRIAETGVVKS